MGDDRFFKSLPNPNSLPGLGMRVVTKRLIPETLSLKEMFATSSLTVSLNEREEHTDWYLPKSYPTTKEE